MKIEGLIDAILSAIMKSVKDLDFNSRMIREAGPRV